jgi:polyhydroxyalkanoate synthase
MHSVPPRDRSEFGKQAAEAVGPENELLAAVDPVGFGEVLARTGLRLASNPQGVLEALSKLGLRSAAATSATAARIAGADARGPLEPPEKDRRFGDPAWSQNPLYFLLLQEYLAGGRFLQELVDAARLEEPDEVKARFAIDRLVDALAPTNFLPGNPAALKKAFDTGGGSLLRGFRAFLRDVADNKGMPRQIERGAFKVGRDLAATPGKVVLRNDLMELLQYEPRTETVFEVPLLCSPPWINKYYVMDLAPGRSFVEWAVDHGHTVFAISYRNPDATMRHITLDDYLVHGPRAALDRIEEITGSSRANIVGLCLGGTLTAMLIAYLAKRGETRVNSATLLNTLIDFSRPGVLGAFSDEKSVRRLERQMARRGFLQADQMASTFTLMRANDLIWNYVVNNWLLGEPPPPFDILAWNDDGTRLPAAMHSFYLRSCYLRNEFAAGVLELAGEQIEAGAIACDTYILAAIEDHIAPWKSQYLSTGLLVDADCRFVLSSSGHIAGIVNPPSPKASFWTNDELAPDPDAWLAGATLRPRSWWEDWAEWIGTRSGALRPPPPRVEALGDAPGDYVHAR